MDVPKGVAMKPPRALFISLWRLFNFWITKIIDNLQCTLCTDVKSRKVLIFVNVPLPKESGVPQEYLN
jgi:hypothetical protein